MLDGLASARGTGGGSGGSVSLFAADTFSGVGSSKREECSSEDFDEIGLLLRIFAHIHSPSPFIQSCLWSLFPSTTVFFSSSSFLYPLIVDVRGGGAGGRIALYAGNITDAGVLQRCTTGGGAEGGGSSHMHGIHHCSFALY